MKIRIPKYYHDFQCAAAACPDPCCTCWEVVADDASKEFYQTVEGPLGEKLRSVMYVDQDGDTCFRLNDGKCPFFLDDRLCEIQKTLGEDALCNTCDMYPRFDEVYGTMEEMGLSLSCPEAARLILFGEDKVEFQLFENDEEEEGCFCEDFDGELLVYLMRVRELAIEILQDRAFPIETRIAIFLQFTDEVQKLIDKETLELIPKLLKNYSKGYTRKTMAAEYEHLRGRWIDKRDIFNDYFKLYLKELEILDRDWADLLFRVSNFVDESSHGNRINAFFASYRDQEYRFENLMVYFVYRYFLQSLSDGEVYVRARLAILSFLMIRELFVYHWDQQDGVLTDEQQLDLIHRYSREVEHSEENLDALLHAFLERKEFSCDALLSVLIN